MIANNDFLKDSPDEAKAFLAATEKGYQYAIDNPKKAADILIEGDDTGSLKGSEDLVYKSQEWLSKQYVADADNWGVIDETRWNNFYTWLAQNKLTTKDLIIKDINIELNQGELVSLLGVSGSGKTTLFHVLSGLTTPEEGKVFLNGEDITSKPGQITVRKGWRKKLLSFIICQKVQMYTLHKNPFFFLPIFSCFSFVFLCRLRKISPSAL